MQVFSWVREGTRLPRLVPDGCAGGVRGWSRVLVWPCPRAGDSHPSQHGQAQPGHHVGWPGSCQNPGLVPAKPTQSGQHHCLQAEGTIWGRKRRFLPKIWLLGGSAACSQGRMAPGLMGTCQPGGPPACGRVGDATKRAWPVILSPIKLEAERDPRRGQQIIYLTFLLRCPSPPLWAAVPFPSPEDAEGSWGWP